MNKFSKIFRISGLVMLIAALILEILPIGAVLVFMPEPGHRLAKTFSFFSLTPFGYANFTPMLTGLSTIFAVLLTAIGLIRRRKRYTASAVFATVSAVLAVAPAILFSSTEYMNTASWVIFVLLLISCILIIAANTSKAEKTRLAIPLK